MESCCVILVSLSGPLDCLLALAWRGVASLFSLSLSYVSLLSLRVPCRKKIESLKSDGHGRGLAQSTKRLCSVLPGNSGGQLCQLVYFVCVLIWEHRAAAVCLLL